MCAFDNGAAGRDAGDDARERARGGEIAPGVREAASAAYIEGHENGGGVCARRGAVYGA